MLGLICSGLLRFTPVYSGLAWFGWFGSGGKGPKDQGTTELLAEGGDRCGVEGMHGLVCLD